MRWCNRSAFLFGLLASLPAGAQSISGTVKGLVVDPAGAAIAGAPVQLSSLRTGTVLKTSTNASGGFTFPSVLAGEYDLAIEAPGFQRYVRQAVTLTASEIRDLGILRLTIGEVRESVSVIDEATPLQLASGEKSGLVSGAQLNELALKGRDFLALMTLMPGVVDNGSQARDATSPNAISGIFINGARSEMKNFTVDGITGLDTGSNNTLHYQPNMDSIAEVKVLTSNYQAEYGRSGGGLISVITRGGTRDFHGTGWWTHRHESYNANHFFRNRTGLKKPPYRFNIAGFSAGGPAVVPGKFNTDRSKLFFFASQEYTRQRVDFGSRFLLMPSELERAGNFSRSYDVSGRLIPVLDPSTGASFPGNVIPPSRLNALGQSILKFFPLPNYTDPDPALRNRQNYRTTASGSHPRRNDMVRFDVYPTSKLHGYFRYVNDADDLGDPFYGYGFTYTTISHPNPGHGYGAHLTYTISSTLLNEFILGKSWNSWQYRPKDPAQVLRSKIGDIPQWFPNEVTTGSPSESTDSNLMPNISFGGIPANPPSVTLNNMQHINHNDTWDLTDNFSWIRGSHSLKAGLYVNLTDKVQVHGDAWNGVLNFATNRNNPFDSGHAFANAALGNFNTYLESTRGINFHAKYSTYEFYLQDNWRASRRLTLDYGVRFYRLNPQYDLNRTFAAFDFTDYNAARAPRLYWPALDARNRRVGIDRLTGQTVDAALIGKFVPNSGDVRNGMKVGGVDGYPGGLYTISAISTAPRFGFAWDVSGRGTTVLRGGIGVFLDRSRQLINVNTVTNPPVSYRPTGFYGNLATLAQSAGYLGPSTIRFVMPEREARQPSVMNYSFGIQQQLPLLAVLDISYVGSVSRHLLQARNLNIIPMYSRFAPENADPSVRNQPLAADFFRPLPGIADLTTYEFAASGNYNSLQLSIQRRFSRRLSFGVAYTWSKALGVADAYTDVVSSYFRPRERDYGPYPFDRSHVFTLNYVYEFPNAGRRLAGAAGAAILDRWSISGVTSFVSGAPFTPGFSTTFTTDITGSGEGARITVTGDPALSKSEKNFYRNFRQEVFALTPVRSFGNAGVGILRGPGVNNWDFAVGKQIPLGLGEGRALQFRAEAYNAFNHTQFSGVDTGARFDQTGQQVNANFGAFTQARTSRIISFSLRLRF